MNRNTTVNNKAGTFTEGQEQEEQTNVIFAEETKINPAKVSIDPVKEENDEPNLDEILGEDDSSSSSGARAPAAKKDTKAGAADQAAKAGATKVKNDDDSNISEEERKALLDDMMKSDSEDEEDDDEDYGGEESEESSENSSFDERRKKDDDEVSGVSFDDLANKSIDSGPQELPAVADKSNYLPFISPKYEFQNDVLEVIE